VLLPRTPLSCDPQLSFLDSFPKCFLSWSRYLYPSLLLPYWMQLRYLLRRSSTGINRVDNHRMDLVNLAWLWGLQDFTNNEHGLAKTFWIRLSPTDRLQPANDAKHYGSTATGGVKRSAANCLQPTAADDVRSTAANDAKPVPTNDVGPTAANDVLKVGAIV